MSSTPTDTSGKGGNWTRCSVNAATANTVSLGVVGKVVAVRYAWEDSPSIFTSTGPAVFNGEGLPATPSLLNVTSAN